MTLVLIAADKSDPLRQSSVGDAQINSGNLDVSVRRMAIINVFTSEPHHTSLDVTEFSLS
jgi:hypothetical protein